MPRRGEYSGRERSDPGTRASDAKRVRHSSPRETRLRSGRSHAATAARGRAPDLRSAAAPVARRRPRLAPGARRAGYDQPDPVRHHPARRRRACRRPACRDRSRGSAYFADSRASKPAAVDLARREGADNRSALDHDATGPLRQRRGRGRSPCARAARDTARRGRSGERRTRRPTARDLAFTGSATCDSSSSGSRASSPGARPATVVADTSPATAAPGARAARAGAPPTPAAAIAAAAAAAAVGRLSFPAARRVRADAAPWYP